MYCTCKYALYDNDNNYLGDVAMVNGGAWDFVPSKHASVLNTADIAYIHWFMEAIKDKPAFIEHPNVP